MTPDERGELYETLEKVIEAEGLEGLGSIVDALVTITHEKAEDYQFQEQEEDFDYAAKDWQEASNALDNVLANYINTETEE